MSSQARREAAHALGRLNLAAAHRRQGRFVGGGGDAGAAGGVNADGNLGHDGLGEQGVGHHADVSAEAHKLKLDGLGLGQLEQGLGKLR